MKKFVTSIIGVIILGIFSSALWDKLFKPLTEILFRLLLYVSTLGIEKYRNGIYSEIAKGFHESVSLEILTWITSVFVGTVVAVVFLKIKGHKKSALSNDGFLFKTINRIYFLILYLVFSITFVGLNIVKIQYINRSIVYFEQLLNVVSTEITDDSYKGFQSEFAEIKTKNDYISSINKLKRIGKKSGKKLPIPPSFIF